MYLFQTTRINNTPRRVYYINKEKKNTFSFVVYFLKKNKPCYITYIFNVLFSLYLIIETILFLMSILACAEKKRKLNIKYSNNYKLIDNNMI